MTGFWANLWGRNGKPRSWLNCVTIDLSLFLFVDRNISFARCFARCKQHLLDFSNEHGWESPIDFPIDFPFNHFGELVELRPVPQLHGARHIYRASIAGKGPPLQPLQAGAAGATVVSWTGMVFFGESRKLKHIAVLFCQFLCIHPSVWWLDVF